MMVRFIKLTATEWRSCTVCHNTMILDTTQQKFRELRAIASRNADRNSQISSNTCSVTGAVILKHWKI